MQKIIDDIVGSRTKLIIISLGVLGLYFLPLLIFWDHSLMVVNDTLDSHIVWYKILKGSGKIFAGSLTPMPEIMNTPRFTLYNEFFLLFWLHYFFGTFPAYVINLILIHFTAFWGMYFLLNSFSKQNFLYTILIALIFSLLPFQAYWGLSEAGQPFVFYALLKINLKGFRLKYLFITLFYILYSNFYSSSVFFFFFLFLFLLFLVIKRNKVSLSVWLVFFLMIVLSLAMEYRLISQLFMSHDYVSSRVERSFGMEPSFIKCSYASIKNLLSPPYSGTNYLALFIPLILWSYYQAIRSKLVFTFFYHTLFFFIIFSVVVFGFGNCDLFGDIYQQFHSLRFYTFQRIIGIIPLLWILVLYLSLRILPSRYFNIAMVFVFLQIGYLFCFNLSYRGYLKHFFKLRNQEEVISFADFFAEPLFTQIRDSLHYQKGDFKIACLGFHPSISQYNGFYTLDGYLTNYPLSYKHEFRAIIEPELEKNELIRDYFDKWGSRCYLYNNELGTNFLNYKRFNKEVSLFDINCEQFVEMGGRYIFSAVKINRFSCGPASLIGVFEDKTWRIYVYEIK